MQKALVSNFTFAYKAKCFAIALLVFFFSVSSLSLFLDGLAYILYVISIIRCCRHAWPIFEVLHWKYWHISANILKFRACENGMPFALEINRNGGLKWRNLKLRPSNWKHHIFTTTVHMGTKRGSVVKYFPQQKQIKRWENPSV